MRSREEIAQYKKEYALKNKEKIKVQQAEFYKNNSDVIKIRSNERFLNNKEEILLKNKEYREKHLKVIKENMKKYALKNKETIGAYVREYNKWKRSGKEKEFPIYYKENKVEIEKNYEEYLKNQITDPLERKNNRRVWVKKYNYNYKKKRKSEDATYKLTTIIRSLISGSIKRFGYSKTSKTCDILGCTFEEFKTYLESKFESWMNWDNYGNWNGYPCDINVAWDIDHIVPLSTVNTEEDIIKLNHYTNLQPLCSYTNRHIKCGNVIVK